MEIVPDRNYCPIEVNITEEPKADKLALPLLILVLILLTVSIVLGYFIITR